MKIIPGMNSSCARFVYLDKLISATLALSVLTLPFCNNIGQYFTPLVVYTTSEKDGLLVRLHEEPVEKIVLKQISLDSCENMVIGCLFSYSCQY